MREADVRQKVSVFISSNIDENYKVVREALCLLLLQTCMCETYCFEEEPGSSMDVVSSYLYKIDRSDLVVFLIDNAKGVGPGTLKEVKRSRDLKKKCIFLFCNENEKEYTELQKEIMNASTGEKYKEVSQISHMAEVAYLSVINDIIDIYLTYCGNQFQMIEAAENEKYDIQDAEINNSSTILKKSSYRGYDYIKTILKGYALYDQNYSGECSDFEREAGELFKFLLGSQSLETIDFSLLKEHTLEFFQSRSRLKTIVQHRLEALEYYLKGKLEDTISSLGNALSVAQKIKSIPQWIVNDIAIDLRNITFDVERRDNVFSKYNQGQKILDESEEPVYYPVVDRAAYNFYEAAFKDSLQKITESPFSVSIGGIDQNLGYLVDSFVAALMYGSITHINLIREKLAQYLEYLSFKTRSHKTFSSAVQMLLMTGDAKELEKFLESYGEYTDSINELDIKAWLDAVETIGIKYKRFNSEILLLSNFGYYFSDTDFEEFYEEIKGRFIAWTDEQFASDLIARAYIKAVDRLSNRIDTSEQIKLAFLFRKKGFVRWYNDIFKMLGNISIDGLTEEMQRKYIAWLIECCRDKKTVSSCPNLPYAIQTLRHHLNQEDDLDAVVEESFPNFYKNTYSLNVFCHDNEEFVSYLNKQIEDIHNRNEDQGKNGCYKGYAFNPFATIRNIVNRNRDCVSVESIRDICDAILETLNSERQTLEDKCSAMKLMNMMLCYWKDCESVKKTVEEIIHNKEKYKHGQGDFLNRGYSERLYRCIFRYIEIFSDMVSDIEIVKHYSLLSTFEDSETILFLRILREMIDDSGSSQSHIKGMNSLLQYLFEMSRSKDKTVRYLSFVNMINIIKYYDEYTDVVLEYASHAMDSETYVVKIAILSRVVKLDKESSLVDYIISKGKVDSHYYLRKVASK